MTLHKGQYQFPVSAHNSTTAQSYGVPPEGTVTIDYTEGELATSDGAKVYLRTPNYSIENTYQPLPDDVEISPRVAPVVFGLGLLEAIPESTILALADEEDRDGDGISGKANYVWDVQKNGLSLGQVRVESKSADTASTGRFRLPRRYRNYNLAFADRELGWTTAIRRTRRRPGAQR